MKKVLAALVVLSLSACNNMSHDQQQPMQPQMPNKMEMVKHCIHHSGVKMPPMPMAGQAPHKLTHKQKHVLDMCLKENDMDKHEFMMQAENMTTTEGTTQTMQTTETPTTMQ
jgi:hypothetical protein